MLHFDPVYGIIGQHRPELAASVDADDSKSVHPTRIETQTRCQVIGIFDEF